MQDERRRALGVTDLCVRQRTTVRRPDKFGGFLAHTCHPSTLSHGRDVRLWGGAQAIQQYMSAGLLDELELHVVPVLLGRGERLFDNLGDAEPQLEQVRAVDAPGVTHLKYRLRPGP